MTTEPEKTGAEKTEKSASTETKPESKTPESKTGEKKEPTTRELVKGFRAEMDAAKEATTSKKSEKSKDEAEEEPEKKGAEKKAESKTAADSDEKSDDEKPKRREFSPEDFKKKGFFDSLSKEDWKVINEDYPAQAEAWRTVQRAVQAHKDSLKKADQEKQSTKSAKESEDDDDDKALIVDLLDDEKTFKKGVRKLVNHPDAKPIFRELVREYLQENGLDLSEVKVSKTQRAGLDLAAEEYPELDDEGFFNEVCEMIDGNEKAAKVVKTSTDPDKISDVFQKYAAKLKLERLEKKNAKPKKTPEEERAEKLRRETQNAKTPGSKAPGTGRKPVEAAEGSTLDIIRKTKAEKDYRHL